MESDAFVSVCDGSSGQPQVFIVDLKNGNQVMKRPMSAEAAIMNPVSKILALRAGQQLQIFNLELRAKMKSHQMPEAVVFWRWVSPSTIALVTPTAVFHWSTEGSSAPTKVFDRHAQLGEGTQVINYQVSPDEKWCLLMGISQGGAGVIKGAMQLYSRDKSVSQTLQGHAGCFHTMSVPGRSDKAQVLCFQEKKEGQPAKLFVMEVGRDASAGAAFRLAPVPIPVPGDAQNDFPVSMYCTVWKLNLTPSTRPFERVAAVSYRKRTGSRPRSTTSSTWSRRWATCIYSTVSAARPYAELELRRTPFS